MKGPEFLQNIIFRLKNFRYYRWLKSLSKEERDRHLRREVADNFIRMREDLHLTCKELSQLSGISMGDILVIEAACGGVPNFEIAKELAGVFGHYNTDKESRKKLLELVGNPYREEVFKMVAEHMEELRKGCSFK